MFVELDAQSNTPGPEYKVVVFIDDISSIVEGTVGCRIICKSGGMIPVKNGLQDIKSKIRQNSGIKPNFQNA